MTDLDPDPGKYLLSLMAHARDEAIAEAEEKEHQQTQALPSVTFNGTGYEPKCKACNHPLRGSLDKDLLTWQVE